jgi:hypothetical protein
LAQKQQKLGKNAPPVAPISAELREPASSRGELRQTFKRPFSLNN